MKWFISDPHIEHEKVLVGKRREAFPTLDDWQRGFVEGVRSCVSKYDHLFILGDFIGKDDARAMAKWRRRLPGNVWLIKGNHDPSDEACARVFGAHNFRHVFMTEVCGIPTWLSHYAHAFWPSSHRGSYHLYGHNHGMRESTLSSWMPGRRSMEVCPEVIHELTGEWRPISEEEVHAILSNRPGHDPVEFYMSKQKE